MLARAVWSESAAGLVWSLSRWSWHESFSACVPELQLLLDRGEASTQLRAAGVRAPLEPVLASLERTARHVRRLAWPRP